MYTPRVLSACEPPLCLVVVFLILPLSSAVLAFALAPAEMQHQWHTACIVHPAPLCSCVQLYISWTAIELRRNRKHSQNSKAGIQRKWQRGELRKIHWHTNCRLLDIQCSVLAKDMTNMLYSNSQALTCSIVDALSIRSVSCSSSNNEARQSPGLAQSEEQYVLAHDSVQLGDVFYKQGSS